MIPVKIFNFRLFIVSGKQNFLKCYIKVRLHYVTRHTAAQRGKAAQQ